VWTHTLLMLDQLKDPTPELALGALLHDVGKPVTFRVADRIRFDGHVEQGVRIADGILRRLRFPGDVSERVLALVANHMRFLHVPGMRESTLKRFLRMERFDEHLELHRVDCLSSHGNLDTYQYVVRKRKEFSEEQLRPPRLIGGDDLIAMGYRPGPAFRRMLEAVETAQLETRIRTREEALEWVRSEFRAPDGEPVGCGS
jgi:poly(A) polymerase